ncbi:class F sortase [Myceligenerans indicum]|uniref:Class F sortase n=1 Tax=Myceligenerans indicum TaxID=2593663 RepID=A0ABS1LJJ1_9MICO|nr:class F sortase [Myceligenerans indicum]MBL0886410.1 class F sortase [Myceligenerans indicum]
MNSGKDSARRRHTLVVAACAALLAVGGSAVAWAASRQVEEPPAPPAAGVTADVTAEPPTAQRATPQPSTPRPSTRQPGSSTRDASGVTPLPASRPVAVRIPGIGVDSPVHGLGLDDEGRLRVPSGARYNQVAWYDGSPTPGEVGPAVLEGHVTGSGYAPSVFFELGNTRPGDRIEVDRADGSTAAFEVTEVRSAPKTDFPRVDVYGATTGPELRVITCGGTFDTSTGHHLDNVIVFASLVRD